LGIGSGNVFINNKVNIRETGPIIGGRKKGEMHLARSVRVAITNSNGCQNHDHVTGRQRR